MGRERWARVVAELQRRARDGRIPATFEVIYGHAWKGEPKRTAEGLPIVKLERPRQR
jgi:malonyl-CoA O-methyltransferase